MIGIERKEERQEEEERQEIPRQEERFLRGRRYMSYYASRLEAMREQLERLGHNLETHQSREPSVRFIDKQAARLEIIQSCNSIRDNVQDIERDIITSLLT